MLPNGCADNSIRIIFIESHDPLVAPGRPEELTLRYELLLPGTTMAFPSMRRSLPAVLSCPKANSCRQPTQEEKNCGNFNDYGGIFLRI